MFLPPKTIFLSTTHKIIFNYDRNKFRYDASFYRPSLTQDKLSHSEIDQFVKEADTIALGTMAKAIKLQKWVVGIFFALLIILFVAAFTDSNGLGKATIGIIIAYFFLGIVFCVMFEQKKRKELTFRMRALLNQQNETIVARGWKWSVAAHFNSIELNKDQSNTNQTTHTPITNLCVPFRQAQYTCGYSAQRYYPDHTDNRFSKQEAEDFMFKVNSIAKGTIQVTGKLTIGYIIFIIVAFIIAIAGSVNHKEGIFKLGIILIVFGVLVGQSSLYLHFGWKRRQMEAKLKELIEENNEMLRERGLGWYCPSSLLRVDLIKYYKAEEARSMTQLDSNAHVILPINYDSNIQMVIKPHESNIHVPMSNKQSNSDDSNNSEIIMPHLDNNINDNPQNHESNGSGSENGNPHANGNGNGMAAPLNNEDVVLNLAEIPGYDNIDNMTLIHNDNVRNNVSNIDETNDITANVNMFPVNNDDVTQHNNNIEVLPEEDDEDFK